MNEKEKIEKLRSALNLILDHVDYRHGACRMNEMVGAVLPVAILAMVENVLRETGMIEKDEVKK